MFDIYSPYLPITLISGTAAVACGLILYFFPPKRINWFYGYRTRRSSSSKDAWKFAQRFSSINLIFSGLLLQAFSLIEFVISFDENSGSISGVLLLLTLLAIPILRTERQLKRRYNRKDNVA